MKTVLVQFDQVFRANPPTIQDSDSGHKLRDLLLILFAFGLIYGAIMGSFGSFAGQRIWQVVFSGLKVPLLLIGTFLLSLPTFFVINTLAGLRDDFAYVLKALVATQSGLTIVLASFGPFTMVWL